MKMTDKSLADEMDSYAYYLTDSSQRVAMTVFAAQARALESRSGDITCKCGSEHRLVDVKAWQQVDELQAELKQCLTAHAVLNDKVCALEDRNDELNKQVINGAWSDWTKYESNRITELKAENAEFKAQLQVRLPDGKDNTYIPPKHGWTCFHCGVTFTKIGSAMDHFGGHHGATVACKIKHGDELGLVMTLRKAEKERDELKSRIEDLESTVAMYEA